MALFTVSFTREEPLDPVVIEVYGGLDAADAYLYASSTPGAAKYRVAAADVRKRYLVEATRYLDAQDWEGEANAAGGTTLAFPRDELSDEPSNAEQLAFVERAAFELAALIAANPTLVSTADQSSNIKRLKGGPAELEFFGPTSTQDGDATVLPPAIDRLIGKWLRSATDALSVVGGESNTSCSDSQFSDCEWRRGR